MDRMEADREDGEKEIEIPLASMVPIASHSLSCFPLPLASAATAAHDL